MTHRASALSGIAVIALIAAGHLSLFPRVADLDGFYHVGHALAYVEGSFLDTSLPWATRSIIGDVGGDLWWGFHVLLAPMAALGGVVWGVRVGAFALTLLLALAVLAVLRRHGVAHAGWWTALFLLAVPNVFYRQLMVRPHVLSLALAMLLLSVLVRGRWGQVMLLSLAIAWIHLSLAWMGPALVVAYGVMRIPAVLAGPDREERAVAPRMAFPAAVAGAGLGWLLRPDALATLSLLRVQLVELFRIQTMELPLTFAAELTPIGLVEMVRSSWLFLVLWMTLLGFVGIREARALRGSDSASLLRRAGREKGTLLLTTLAVSTAFLFVALFSARRAMIQWVCFGFLAFPLVYTILVKGDEGPSRWPRTARLAGLTVLTLHLGWFGWRHALNVTEVAFRGSAFSDVASFLAERSEPGEIVFHARWDNFGPLFAHNRENRYLGGMDPIFLHAHDPESYWEFFYLSTELSTDVTCDAYPCEPRGTVTDTHRVLSDHFGARWVVVEPFRNPLFSLYLLNDPRYAVAFETQEEAVFEILTEPLAAPGTADSSRPEDAGPPAMPTEGADR